LRFYGLVSLRIRAPPSIVSFLRSEWQNFEEEPDGNDPDFEASWMSVRQKSVSPLAVRDGNQTGGWYKGCFWQAEMQERNGRLRVEYWNFPPSKYLFRDSCLEPLLLAMLELRGLHSLHASCIVLADEAWAFCGPPRSGKTMLALTGAHTGHEYLSDDVTIIGSGRVYPYPAPPRIYPHSGRERELLWNVAHYATPFELLVSALLDLTTFGRVRIPTRLHLPALVFPASRPLRDYPLGGLFLLRKGARSPRFNRCENRSTVIQEVVNNSPIHGASMTARHGWGDQFEQARLSGLTKDLGDLVDQGRVFIVDIPEELDATEWKGVLSSTIKLAAEVSSTAIR